MRRRFLPVVIALGGALLGCTSATTRYTPVVIAQGELVVRYDDGFELWAAGQPVATDPRYRGLPAFVRCVPYAHRHAQAARAAGTRALAFSVTAGGLAVAGLGGLAGLAFKDRNNTVMAAFLLTGIGVEVLGAVFAGLARASRLSAMGHAIDAVNYYNDAVGSTGRSCWEPPAPPPSYAP
jgi:hypothetical protein